MYSLFGAGLHGKNGLPPAISRSIYITYILPILLHGLETLVLSKRQLTPLETFHRNTLKQLQSLPTRASNSATYLLIGVEPLECLIDRRIAMMVGRIANQEGSTLHTILHRQLFMKGPNSHSWVIYARHRLLQYNLPSIHSLLEAQPRLSSWKPMVKKATAQLWNARLREDCHQKSSLSYLNIDICCISTPHRIWQHDHDHSHYVARLTVKVRILVGCYLLQSNRQKFNQHEIDGTCPLCNTAVEDRRHFIIYVMKPTQP